MHTQPNTLHIKEKKEDVDGVLTKYELHHWQNKSAYNCNKVFVISEYSSWPKFYMVEDNEEKVFTFLKENHGKKWP